MSKREASVNQVMIDAPTRTILADTATFRLPFWPVCDKTLSTNTSGLTHVTPFLTKRMLALQIAVYGLWSVMDIDTGLIPD